MDRRIVYYIAILSGILGLSKLSDSDSFDLNNVTSCDFCKDIVRIVRDELKISNDTINEVETIMREVCNDVRLEPKKEECLAIVNDIDKIKNLIIDGLQPKQICYRIGFCQ